MPSNVRSPVQVQTPVAVPDGVHGGAHANFASSCSRAVGRRRIFVQTDTGNVLGIELDRADKVQSVKKKVQALLSVPTEQSALIFGDLVLDKDLSEVRNDAPLLLTRGLQRSSSTPCLSPSIGSLRAKDGSQPFEICGGISCCTKIKRLLRESVKAIEAGVEPVPAGGGLGGAYYFRNRRGESIAIVKPTDEEPFAPNNPKGFVGKILGQPGLKRSIRVGETGVREVAAYLLDHGSFAKVPATALVKATHHIFNVNRENSVSNGQARERVPVAKIGSFQQFVRHDFDASDHGTSRFPVGAVHRIGILDVRICNTDRHSGNILVRKYNEEEIGSWGRSGLRVDEAVELIPIDHGLCLPENLEDPYFEWLHWPQASFPFSDEELEYIKNLDANKDVEMLRRELPMLRESCLRMLVLCTTFLQMAAAAGLCLADIGGMMSRELRGVDEEPSELETVCMLAKLEVDLELQAAGSEGEGSVSNEDESSLDQIQFDMDHEDESLSLTDGVRIQRAPCLTIPPSCFSPLSPSPAGPGRVGFNTLLMLQEMHPLEAESLAAVKRYECAGPSSCASTGDGALNRMSRAAKPNRSASLNDGRNFQTFELKRAIGLRGVSASEVTEKINGTPGLSATPLVIGELSEGEWNMFMEYFQVILENVFEKRKMESVGRMQRLGTSCQF